MAEGMAKDHVLISQLAVAYDAMVVEEEKRKIFAWREQHLFRMQTHERIYARLNTLKENVTRALELISNCHSDPMPLSSRRWYIC